MDFKLSKEQEMMRKLFREFAENEVKPLMISQCCKRDTSTHLNTLHA